MAMGVWGSVSIGLAWILTGSMEEAVCLQTPLPLPPRQALAQGRGIDTPEGKVETSSWEVSTLFMASGTPESLP